jgi:hypothetical protein
MTLQGSLPCLQWPTTGSSILKHTNLVHSSSFSFLKVNFNIILQSVRSFSKPSLFSIFTQSNFVLKCIFFFFFFLSLFFFFFFFFFFFCFFFFLFIFLFLCFCLFVSFCFCLFICFYVFVCSLVSFCFCLFICFYVFVCRWWLNMSRVESYEVTGGYIWMILRDL